jgi:hypothetical protein
MNITIILLSEMDNFRLLSLIAGSQLLIMRLRAYPSASSGEKERVLQLL